MSKNRDLKTLIKISQKYPLDITNKPKIEDHLQIIFE